MPPTPTSLSASGLPTLARPGTKRSSKRLLPTLVFARFHLRAQRLEVRFAIDHPFGSARTHIVLHFVVAPFFEHRRNCIVAQKNFPQSDPAALPFREQDLAKEADQDRGENISRPFPHVRR